MPVQGGAQRVGWWPVAGVGGEQGGWWPGRRRGWRANAGPGAAISFPCTSRRAGTRSWSVAVVWATTWAARLPGRRPGPGVPRGPIRRGSCRPGPDDEGPGLVVARDPPADLGHPAAGRAPDREDPHIERTHEQSSREVMECGDPRMVTEGFSVHVCLRGVAASGGQPGVPAHRSPFGHPCSARPEITASRTQIGRGISWSRLERHTGQSGSDDAGSALGGRSQFPGHLADFDLDRSGESNR